MNTKIRLLLIQLKIYCNTIGTVSIQIYVVDRLNDYQPPNHTASHHRSRIPVYNPVSLTNKPPSQLIGHTATESNTTAAAVYNKQLIRSNHTVKSIANTSIRNKSATRHITDQRNLIYATNYIYKLYNDSLFVQYMTQLQHHNTTADTISSGV